MGVLNGVLSPEEVAHSIQVALTPVFLLSGIGTLLNVFNQRVARVSDHMEHLHALLSETADEVVLAHHARHLRRLAKRTLALDAAILCAAVGGGSSCCAAFTLFLVSARQSGGSWVLSALFGVALACTIAALAAFLADSLLSWHGLRRDGPMPRSPARAT